MNIALLISCGPKFINPFLIVFDNLEIFVESEGPEQPWYGPLMGLLCAEDIVDLIE